MELSGGRKLPQMPVCRGENQGPSCGGRAEVQPCSAAPAKTSSLCGRQRLNLKAEAQPHWVGEACSEWGRQMFPRRNPPAFSRVSVGVVSLSSSGSEMHRGRKTLQRRQAAAPQQALGLRSAQSPPLHDPELVALRGPRGAGPGIARGTGGVAWERESLLWAWPPGSGAWTLGGGAEERRAEPRARS